MRVKIHSFIDTIGKTDGDRKAIKEQTRNTILNQLTAYSK
jgi:hypothetical protein